MKKVAKVALPIALTAFTGGLGGVSLAGSLGSFGAGLAKGAAILSKVSFDLCCSIKLIFFIKYI